jgi:heme a synthase
MRIPCIAKGEANYHIRSMNPTRLTPTDSSYRRTALWLLSVALLVFLIVVVGGITRLTESGLSITEWKPLMGALPPLNDAQWLAEFEKYQRIPEYIEINGPAGMDLAQFKMIYFWEWVHRLLGRLIGLALALPFFVLLLLRRLPPGYAIRIFALVMLVGLQGTIGWWMVSSGLETRTDVSHLRLATHLLTAFLILGGLIWTALDLLRPVYSPARMTATGASVLFVLFIQILLGAWVAGLDAGYVSNTWPLMGGDVVPAGIDWTKGIFWALTNDPILIHFMHRWWAWVAVAALVILSRNIRRIGARGPSIAIHSAFGVQILLGIATVMTGVNIVLAVLHQAVGALLVASTVWGVHRLGQQALGVSGDERRRDGLQLVPERGGSA